MLAVSIWLALGGLRESLPRSSWFPARQHRSKCSFPTGSSSSVTQLQLFAHFCFTLSRQLGSSLLFTLFLDSEPVMAWEDFRLTGMRAFLGDMSLVSEAGGVTGGDEEGVRVIQFLMDILRDEGTEPLRPVGERALAGGVFREKVGVFEGRGRSPAQLGAHAADDGEDVDGLLLTRGALAGVLWLLAADPRSVLASFFF